MGTTETTGCAEVDRERGKKTLNETVDDTKENTTCDATTEELTSWKIPKIKEDDDLEMFVTLFETAMISGKIPRRDSKSLHA